MMPMLKTVDRQLDRLRDREILALTTCIVVVVGALDYSTGYELSMSVFYLAPVAVAAWYGRRRTGITVAILSCISWYLADFANGHQYSYPVIPVWNAFVRFGFFLVTSLLLTALRRSLRHQQHLARTDALTGLYGRRAFASRLKHDLALGRRRKRALTLAYMDVDDFKAINDAYGHARGDALLRSIGRVLQGSVREADTPARVGGDEFALIMPDAEGRDARQIISRMRRELRHAFAASHFRVTCSIGVVTFLESATTPESALAAADALMYRVKGTRKGAVAFDVVDATDQTQAKGAAPSSSQNRKN